jgi:hypothetical protein
MDSSARRRGKHRIAPSPSPFSKARTAGDHVRIYVDTHRGRLTAAAVSLAIYPHWAREREAQ